MDTLKILLTTVAVLLLSSLSYGQSENYIIQRRDVLDIVVMEHPEFTISDLVVMPDGYIQYPGFGSVRVAGLSAKELTDSLTSSLNKYVVYPIVSVFVRKIQNQKVNVYGYVNHPGQVQIFEDSDVLSVIAMAGGLKSVKKAKKMTIIRADRTIEHYNLRDMIRRSSKYPGTPLPTIRIGDTIIIDEPKDVNWARLSFFTTLVTSAATITSVIVRTR